MVQYWTSDRGGLAPSVDWLGWPTCQLYHKHKNMNEEIDIHHNISLYRESVQKRKINCNGRYVNVHLCMF